MENVLISYIFVYSAFYFLNYTILGKYATDPLRRIFDISKTRTSTIEKVKYHILYPLFCSYCFGFWANLIGTLSIRRAFVGAFVALILDLIVKQLVKQHGK